MRIFTFVLILLAATLASAAEKEWHWCKATNTVKGWSISQGDAEVVISGNEFYAHLFSGGDGHLESSLKGTIRDNKIVATEVVPDSDYSGSTYHGTLERKKWNEFAGTAGAESITLSDGWGMIGLTRALSK